MTVVVEAAERSGSLITADLAADLGRDLGAVPGPVNSRASAGPNDLLAGGACLVRDAQDVLDAMLGPGVRRVGAGRRRPGRRLREVLWPPSSAGRETCDAIAAALEPRRRRGRRGSGRPRGARLRQLLAASVSTRGPCCRRPPSRLRVVTRDRDPSRALDRRLGLRRRRRHPGRPEGVRALRRARDDRDHGDHGAEHGRGRGGRGGLAGDDRRPGAGGRRGHRRRRGQDRHARHGRDRRRGGRGARASSATRRWWSTR